MTNDQLLQEVQKEQVKKNLPAFTIGDTLCVSYRIKEVIGLDASDKGSKNNKTAAKSQEKERLQSFTGTVIALKGKGASETFTLYRVAYGTSMERVFPVHSPKITKIDVVRKGRVRRAKLYYLRGVSGKKAKVRELLGLPKPAEVASAEAATA